MTESRWLKDSVVETIHQRQLAKHGVLGGIRDAVLLASALARPPNLFAYGHPTPDLAALVASYAFGIARNHAFVDGNRRTAYVVFRTFLLINGHDIVVESADKYLAMLGVAAGSVDEEAFAEWLRTHLVKTSGN